MRASQRPSILTLEKGSLIVSTTYNQSLVDAIKSLPYSERKYDPGRKIWLVDPRHSYLIANWIEEYIGDRVSIPPLPVAGVSRIKQYLNIRYVGACKTRTDGSSTALGLMGEEWKVIFPEQVLRDFFDGSRAAPGQSESYFSVLGVSQSASADEITSGFRRMAKLWHPDICKEENAAETFMRIKAAYDILSDPNKKARYIAGLAFEAMAGNQAPRISANQASYGYRAPLRSGRILIEGKNKSSMIEVSKIFSWDDIVDSQGRILVTSWPSGAKQPIEEWL